MTTLTVFANLDNGLQSLSLFDDAFSAVLTGGTPTIITLSGTDNVPATTFGDILVNVAGLVTLQLPAAATRTVGPVTIADLGHATTYPITILPYGSETIIGLTSVTISNDYGSMTLAPLSTGGWYQK